MMTKLNKYAGLCQICREQVEANEGELKLDNGRWITVHFPGECVGIYGPEIPVPTPEEKRAQQIEEYEANLRSGLVFARYAASDRSAIGYRPCAGSRDYQQILTLAAVLSGSDQGVQLVSAALPKVNPYGTCPQQRAALAAAFAAAVKEPFDDVIGRSGPDAGRPSSHRKPWSLHVLARAALMLALLATESVRGPGWTLQAIIDREGVQTADLYRAAGVKAPEKKEAAV